MAFFKKDQTFLKKLCIYMCTITLIKLSIFGKRKLYIPHHRAPNVIYACILSHTYWKSPEKACKDRYMYK